MFLAGLSLPLIAIGVLSLLSLLELGLTAYVADATRGHIDSNNFLVFCAVWSLLALAYLLLAPRFAPPPFFHRFAPPAILAVTTIFWFAGAVAAAVDLGAPRCQNSVCSSFQAAIAFAFFIWVIFTGLTVLEGLELRKNHAPHPHMGQPETAGPHPPYPSANPNPNV